MLPLNPPLDVRVGIVGTYKYVLTILSFGSSFPLIACNENMEISKNLNALC